MNHQCVQKAGPQPILRFRVHITSRVAKTACNFILPQLYRLAITSNLLCSKPVIQCYGSMYTALVSNPKYMACKCYNDYNRLPNSQRSRWLRLLFTREFSMPDAMMLWDGLFATDPTMALSQWVCVAMLIRIRNERKPSLLVLCRVSR